MRRYVQNEILLSTSLGGLRIRSFCTPEEIGKLRFDRQFGTHAHYRSLYTKRESLEKKAEQADTSVVLAIADAEHIVGFGVLAYPDPEERWASLQPQVMMEVNAIEVSRSWRSRKIAKGIIQMMMVHQEYQTNEPNICLRPENIFMARIGENVSREIQNQFKWLRFGMTP